MQKGRSMIEMLSVLVIITILTIGAMAGWRHTRQKMYVTETQNEIALIEQDISNLFNWSRGYPNSTPANFMKTLCAEDVFPSGCTVTNEAYHPLDKGLPDAKGLYNVEFVNGDLRIWLYHLPSEDICNELLTSAKELRHYIAGQCNANSGSVYLLLTFE